LIVPQSEWDKIGGSMLYWRLVSLAVYLEEFEDMTLAKRALLIVVVLIGCAGCDQTTKSVAQTYFPIAESWSFLGDTVRLQLTYNSGAFLGLGSTLPELWRHALFGVGSLVILFGLLGYTLFAEQLPAVGVWALAFYFAGGISNLIDRWFHDGYVIDFINVGIGPLRTGIFNVADLFVTAGACLLLLHEIERVRRQSPSQETIT
jgi:signal peptidase II